MMCAEIQERLMFILRFDEGANYGNISNIKTAPSNMTKNALLTPAVDFSSLDMVLIITEEKEKYTDTNTKEGK